MLRKAAIVVLVLMIPALGTLGQPLIVEDIEIRGHRRVSREQIVKRVKTSPGMKFDEAQLRKDFAAVMAMGEFDTTASRVVTMEGVRNGIIVVLLLKELPK